MIKTTLRNLGTIFLVASFMTGLAFAKSVRYLVLVGTYTTMDGKDTGSKGIYAYRFNESSGKLAPRGVAAETANPSFLAVARNKKFVYAVNELQNYGGGSSGGVTAFALDRASGKLRQLNEVASRGADPCYISFDRTGKYALVANYTGGTVAVFPISANGHIGEASSVQDDKGTLGPNKARQEHSHAHWIEVSAHNRYAYVSDLGLDRVLIYKFDAAKGVLSSEASGPDNTNFFSAKLEPGTGPRHVAFSSDGNFMYVLGEMDATVTVFKNDNETFQPIQKIPSLPEGFSGENTAAEIVIHPSGKFLYTSNRGEDAIVVFAIDQATGKLTFVQRISTGGKEPRNFAIDPSGARLLVANQNSGNIVGFKIDSGTGKLESEGEVAKVPAPVCIVFVPE
ncbi:MAG TPA: lactonase family protein [Terriglobales bacterium]|nr:lactonase family protein [Terriglobales bacterium]